MLKVNQDRVTPGLAQTLIDCCPFDAIGYENEKLTISPACKMCKTCVKRSGGAIEYVADPVKTVDKSLWKGICVYADCQNGDVHRVTYELIGKAKELAKVTSHPVYVLLIGENTASAAQKLRHYGVGRIYLYDDPVFAQFRVEPYTAAFHDFIEKVKPSSILVGATTLGRQLAPRVAARCRTGLTADCTVLDMKENTDLVQIRPAFGGNIMAQIVSPNTRPQFCTVRYKVFAEPQPCETPSGEIIRMALPQDLHSAIEILQVAEKPKDIDIAEADVIVAVGRGAQSEELRQQAQILADLLGGRLACTRPLVESGIFDARHQIGLSGRTVKPKFILCLGISGAVQFAAGMKASDVICAINTDPNAPIFDVAHYCVVGDVGEILPQLIYRFKEAKS